MLFRLWTHKLDTLHAATSSFRFYLQNFIAKSAGMPNSVLFQRAAPSCAASFPGAMHQTPICGRLLLGLNHGAAAFLQAAAPPAEPWGCRGFAASRPRVNRAPRLVPRATTEPVTSEFYATEHETFSSLGLSAELEQALGAAGFSRPSRVQVGQATPLSGAVPSLTALRCALFLGTTPVQSMPMPRARALSSILACRQQHAAP